MARQTIKLPTPEKNGGMPLRDTIFKRRTIRDIDSASLSLLHISQLLWATYGISSSESSEEFSHHVVPSAGHSFPLILYVVSEEGLYSYSPEQNNLNLIKAGDLRRKLGYEGLYEPNQEAIRAASHTIIITVDNEKAIKTTPLLEDALRFVHLEAGHAAQNFVLQVTELGLGTTTITSFDISKVFRVLQLPFNHRPIYILPVGRAKNLSGKA